MAWRCTTVAPAQPGSNYLSFVTRPDGFAPDPRLTAVNTGRNEYTFNYIADENAKAAIDIWDTGILYTGRDPHSTSMCVSADGGGGTEVETPEIADGGGGGGRGIMEHKVRLLKSLKTVRITRKPKLKK